MKKWLKRSAYLIALLAGVLITAIVATALRGDRRVGFQMVRASDASGQPFAVAIWYPSSSQPRPTTLLGMALMSVAPDGAINRTGLPMVVISHGNAGGPGSHADLAMDLASAGFVVAAPMHQGDNYADQSALASPTFVDGRKQQLRATVDFMLRDWSGRQHIDAQRIGAYGFSAGGLTVLTAAGARFEPRLVARHCASSAEFACQLLKKVGSPLLSETSRITTSPALPDARIKAAVVAAPGIGFGLDIDSLAAIRIPVQLWHAAADDSVPFATNARRVRDAVGQRAEFHEVPHAGHFAFLTPCQLIGPPMLCRDAGQFDRRAFHSAMNAKVVAFFRASMPESSR